MAQYSRLNKQHAQSSQESPEDEHNRIRDKKFVCCVCLFLVGILEALFIACSMTFPWIFGPCRCNIKPVPYQIPYIPRTIGFGSCMDNEKMPRILNYVNTEVFVFLGDNIYADTTNSLVMWWLYNRLSCKREFQSLVDRTPYVLAIWDDHDYGGNDCGKEYSMKQISQKQFLNFWNIPASHPRNHLNGGVYGAYKFHDGKSPFSILVILLDLRYFRDTLTFYKNGTRMYIPTLHGSMLGEVQWSWLEETLAANTDSYIIIASSTQIGPENYGFESWRNMPLERARLLSMLDPSRSMFISGDLHQGEISLTEEGYWDVSSSGLSQLDLLTIPNVYRVGDIITEYNYGVLDLSTTSPATASLWTEGATQSRSSVLLSNFNQYVRNRTAEGLLLQDSIYGI